MKVSLLGDWQKAQRIVGTMGQKFKMASQRAMMQEAQFLRAEIVKGIREGAPGGKAFKELSHLTLAMRKGTGFKGTKPLIRRGELRGSVVVKTEQGGAFVGVLKSARSKDGKSLVNIAEVHEYGAGPFVVPITPKSRRFYHAAMARAGYVPFRGKHPGTRVQVAIIKIPARPFLRPVFDKFAKPEDVRERFYARLAGVFEDVG